MHKMIQNALKLYFYVRRVGITGLSKRVVQTLHPTEISYDAWKKKNALTKSEWNRQREESLQWNVSVDVTCLFDGSAKHVYKSLEQQSAATPLDTKKGEYILLVGKDVHLASDASYHLVKKMLDCPQVDVVYCDHDVDATAPIFKPDYNKDFFFNTGYIGPVVLVKRKLWEQTAAFSDTYYDRLLSIVSGAQCIGHVARPLYHVISAEKNNDAADFNLALERFLNRENPRLTIKDGLVEGTKHIVYPVDDSKKVSVIIPNKDHKEDLEKCIASIRCQNYKNIEILIVENNSCDPETFVLYEKLEQEPDIKVIRWEKPFNYAAVNNYATAQAQGEFLLFLNNDIEFRTPNALMEMLGLCQREGTGAVGIKLYYPDGTIQHAGVVIGYGGIAGHAFLGCDGDSHGYMNRIDCVQNYSAVTAACMMVDRQAYDACGGFDERFEIAFNDIDFCLKIKEYGYDIVYTPYAQAWHYESKSRGAEDTYRKMKRFNDEVDLFRTKWMHFITQGDPAYNPNLTLDRWDFSLKR